MDRAEPVPDLPARDDPLLSLMPGVEPLVFEGRPMLFLPDRQQLLALNEGAAPLAARLLEGCTLTELSSAMSLSLNAADIAATLGDWSALGLLRSDQGGKGAERGAARMLTAGGLSCGILFAKGTQARLAEPYRHLDKGTPGIAADISIEQADDRVLIRSRGRPVTIAGAERAGLALRRVILDRVMAADGIVTLHGASLRKGAELVLLIGPPGSGKSTLAAMMSACGFGLAGDDIVVIDRDTGAMNGLPLPLSVKEGSLPLLTRLFPDLPRRPAFLREDGETVRYRPLPPPGGAGTAGRVSAIVRITRDDKASCAVREWQGDDCLRQLLADCHHPTGRAEGAFVRALARQVEHARRIEFTYPDAGEGARALAAALAS